MFKFIQNERRKTMLTRKMIVGMIMVILVGVNLARAQRSYTYVLTVCMDSNDPNYDPNTNYDKINDAVVAMNEKDPPLDSNTLGSIQVYDGNYVEYLNDYYEPNGHNLPAHCDLIGMGQDIDDVEIRSGGESIPENTIAGVKANGDNIISHLKVCNYPSSAHQLGVRLADDSILQDCIIETNHAGMVGGENLVVTDCTIRTYVGPCIRALGTFSISDCELKPMASSHNIETPAGVHALGTGTIEDVNIYGGGVSSYKLDGGILSGIHFMLAENEQVFISNVDIDLQLTSKYLPSEPGALRVCGILSGSNWEVNDSFKGQVVVRDCNIAVTGIEDTNGTGDPNDDGAGVMVDGIWISGGGKIEVYGDTSIATGRTTASNAEDGYEYLLNNENGTLVVNFDTVVFDPNGDGDPNCYDPNYVNGSITDYRITNLTQGTKYFFIQDAIDDANDEDVIEATESIYFEAVDFNGVSCTLRSADPCDWDVVERTIIDPDGVSTTAVLFNSGEDANSVLSGFTLTNTSGRSVWCASSSPIISNCIIENGGEGIRCTASASPKITNNKISKNTSSGIYYLSSSPTIKNNWIYDNGYGIRCINAGSSLLRNNTIVGNTTEGIMSTGTAPTISNCILWDNGDDLYGCSATYSCIKDINDANGVGNISSDPNFVDAINDDYHIHPYSPCVDAGDPNTTGASETDIDGEPRRMDPNGITHAWSIVDMGADEVLGKVHNITQDAWYLIIQEAIDDANDGDTIEVREGTYSESVNFKGKAITVRSTDPNDWKVVEETVITGYGSASTVWFNSGEDSNSCIVGFSTGSGRARGITCNASSPTIAKCIIEVKSQYGVYCLNASPIIMNNKIRQNQYGILSAGSTTPKIKNNWIYDNSYGIHFVGATSPGTVQNNTVVESSTAGIYVFSGTEPNITNCILWSNGDDLYNCSATYSCIEDCNDANGTGNICGDANDPLFVDDANDDYHLEPNSPCIDEGDPNGDYSSETDIDGEPRVMDGYADGNDIVDMGADEVGCLSYEASEHADWAAWGAPDCWCYERQCRGDADGVTMGPYWVGGPDLALFNSAYQKTDDNLPEGGICADLDHQKMGPYRVGSSDLGIFQQYYLKTEANVPCCDADEDCVLDPNDDYNFWTN
jgi:parallel beta-helix repeat protein